MPAYAPAYVTHTHMPKCTRTHYRLTPQAKLIAVRLVKLPAGFRPWTHCRKGLSLCHADHSCKSSTARFATGFHSDLTLPHTSPSGKTLRVKIWGSGIFFVPDMASPTNTHCHRENVQWLIIQRCWWLSFQMMIISQCLDIFIKRHLMGHESRHLAIAIWELLWHSRMCIHSPFKGRMGFLAGSM